MSFDAALGPINYLVVTFAAAPVPSSGLEGIQSLVDQGRIAVVLDIEFVSKDADGVASRVSASDVGAPEFDGASAQLIDEDDIALVAESLQAGGVGLVVMYEDLTMLPVLATWEAEGATVVSEGPVSVDDLIEALGASDSES